jgi:DNA polymerase I-like protein with 3'-5' exonuclease and polymerase domains
MSCRGPNLQNPPNDFEGLVVPADIEEFFLKQGLEIPMVPHMRRYLLPEEGHIWIKRDFSAQEMRIMAHFAEGRLYTAFRADPTTDPHVAVQKMIKELLNIDMPRKFVKITGFGIMYGRGVPNLSLALGVDPVEGKRVRDAYYAALPEIQQLSYDTRSRGKRGQFIRTWGGRVYYREPDPARDLSYKLLNYLVQGSAADQTKQSIIDHDTERAPTDVLLAAVHDEINVSAPIDDRAGAMLRLRAAMDKDRFDVPFRSEGFSGPNWGDITEYEV